VRVGFAVALAAVALAGGGAAAAPATPSASARAWAVRVLVPGRQPVGTAVVTGAPGGERQIDAAFAFPENGSIVRTGQATAVVASGKTAASGASSVGRVSVFGGEIVARTVNGAARGGETSAGFDGTAVVGLRALGKPVAKGRAALGRWGTLTVHRSGVSKGTSGYHSFITALDIRLKRPHGGLPAGSEIQLGHADLSLPAAPAPPLPAGPLPGDRPQLLPRATGPLVGVPQLVTPPLDAGPYIFPVFGPTTFYDTYGATGAGSAYHHGDDLFGELGQPVLAAANGSLFSLGWNRADGNRVWLRDHQGNLFYYANLAAFSTKARNAARVRAGDVIGFMGNTGTAEGTATHLHFEVHPVSLIYLGSDGAVDPTTYLQSWRRLRNLPFAVATGWAPSPPGVSRAPEPGAMLIGGTDIATGGLGGAKP
jgi:murein DD-endopeptidase MepM/ murein hydrolase activator NlpD